MAKSIPVSISLDEDTLNTAKRHASEVLKVNFSAYVEGLIDSNLKEQGYIHPADEKASAMQLASAIYDEHPEQFGAMLESVIRSNAVS